MPYDSEGFLHGHLTGRSAFARKAEAKARPTLSREEFERERAIIGLRADELRSNAEKRFRKNKSALVDRETLAVMRERHGLGMHLRPSWAPGISLDDAERIAEWRVQRCHESMIERINKAERKLIGQLERRHVRIDYAPRPQRSRSRSR